MVQTQHLPEEHRLLALVDAMAGQPVTMVVDLVVDRYILGTPKRISREAPVLILAYEGERFVPGGGANAVANVAALGGRPRPIGVVGDDVSGRELTGRFGELGIPTDGIVVRPGYRTPTKTRILAGARYALRQQVVRIDAEDHVELTAVERSRLLASAPGEGGVIVLSDYGYGSATPDVARELRQRLGTGATLLVDSRYRLSEYRGVDGATPNQEEAEGILGAPIPEEPARLDAAGRIVRERLGVGFLLVTRGSRGMTLVDAWQAAHVPVHGTDQVADVTGAGDTVIGTFALALAAGASPLEATLLANYAGGVVVQKMGTATLGPDELRNAIRSDATPRENIRWAGY